MAQSQPEQKPEYMSEALELRKKYITALGGLFHRVNADELAELSLKKQVLATLIEDYINIITTKEFREKFYREKSKLEEITAKTQSPRTKYCHGPANNAEVYG